MPYVDPATVHNPATNTVAPAAWGDVLRDDLEFLIDPPACSVAASGAQSIADNTSVVLNASVENFDNDSMHSTVTNNSRITIQTSGRYLLISTILFGANGTGRRGTNFFVNGTTSHTGLFVDAVTGASTAISGARMLTLVAGDYVESRGFQNSGGNLDVTLQEFAVTFLTR